MAVFVVDKRKKPLMPCSEKRARLLLARRRAVVHRRYPFTIRLKDRVGGAVQPLRLKLDPGASTTGVALVREAADGQHVLHLAEITHRGKVIHAHMQQRAMFRRRRRSANLRYRAKRFDNRCRLQGWLPPSLQSRVDSTIAWVQRYQRLAPVGAISVEHVRFDTQVLQNPDISGVAYQQGTLAGYEVREYLLETWKHRCAYCGVEGVPLNVEHIHPRSRGGSDRVSNLCVACRSCNEAKGSRPVAEFLRDKSDQLARVLAQAREPLDAAAAVNATRWALVDALRRRGVSLDLASGGRTKFNRAKLGVPKQHCLDAACVGCVEALHGWDVAVLCIGCRGRGSYQRTLLSAHGFPRGYLMRQKQVRGFQTGDIVRASVPSGKKAGEYIGR
ncbi:MAG TPA: RNA-guided endonuclease IscB, partial [Chloroflexota bacterium]|nr:RNA-guided endonuclease IscB [Chloroflexota bacterium]